MFCDMYTCDTCIQFKTKRKINNLFCFFADNASRNANEESFGRGKVEQLGFAELLEKHMCRCSQEKVFCHNVHLPNLLAFPTDVQFL